MNRNDLFFSSYTSEYLSLAGFSSVSLIPATGRATRRNSTTVANPRSLHARKDGRFTIRGRNKHETRVVNLRGGILRTVTLDGVVNDYAL